MNLPLMFFISQLPKQENLGTKTNITFNQIFKTQINAFYSRPIPYDREFETTYINTLPGPGMVA